MTTALQSAEQHMADLAANRVPAKDKPSAFHHGLIVTLVAELRLCQLKLDGEEAIRRGAFEKIDALKQRIDATEKELHATLAIVRRLVERADHSGKLEVVERRAGPLATVTASAPDFEDVIADARKVLR